MAAAEEMSDGENDYTPPGALETGSRGRSTVMAHQRKTNPVQLLRSALGPLAEIREPKSAEAPILAPGVRAALFAWIMEISSAADLIAVGLRARSTALLFGPPGCGKTTLAHHFAARLGIPLVIVGPESIFGRYMGDSEKSMARLFDKLQEAGTPCVLFMDELEALGGNRDNNTAGGADNGRTAALGVLLRKIEEYKGYCIGATNRKEDIDPALWRRFGLQIEIDLPGPDERFTIMRRYGLPFQISDDDLDVLVDATDGASPALLRGLMEGMKRNLVVRPRVNLPIDSAIHVMMPVVESMAPPPQMKRPPLWCGDEALPFLEKLSWPPTRGQADGP